MDEGVFDARNEGRPRRPVDVVQFLYGEQTVRSLIDKDGQAWVSALDVCKVLGYSNPHAAVSAHCEDEGRLAKHEVPTTSGIQALNFINESNLYMLIFASKLPAAKEFRLWVTREVLPALRTRGVYTLNEGKAPPPLPAASPDLEEALSDLSKLPIQLSFARQDAIRYRLQSEEKDLRIAELEHEVKVLEHLGKWQESTRKLRHAQMKQAAELREKGTSAAQIGHLLGIEAGKVDILVNGWKALVALQLTNQTA